MRPFKAPTAPGRFPKKVWQPPAGELWRPPDRPAGLDTPSFGGASTIGHDGAMASPYPDLPWQSVSDNAAMHKSKMATEQDFLIPMLERIHAALTPTPAAPTSPTPATWGVNTDSLTKAGDALEGNKPLIITIGHDAAPTYDYGAQPVGPHGISFDPTHNDQGGSFNFPGLLSNDPNQFLAAARSAMGTPWQSEVPNYVQDIIKKGGSAQDVASNPGWSQNVDPNAYNAATNAGFNQTPWGQQLTTFDQQQRSNQYATVPGATQNAQGVWQTPAQQAFASHAGEGSQAYNDAMATAHLNNPATNAASGVVGGSGMGPNPISSQPAQAPGASGQGMSLWDPQHNLIGHDPNEPAQGASGTLAQKVPQTVGHDAANPVVVQPQNPGFFQGQQIQQQPYPTMPGFGATSLNLFNTANRGMANPYGYDPNYTGQGPNALNPFGGQGTFDPYTGTYSGAPSGNSSLPGASGSGSGASGGVPQSAWNVGGPVSPWLMPYQGSLVAGLDPNQMGAMGGLGSQLAKGPPGNSGYQAGSSPWLDQYQGGALALKNIQDALAQKQIASSMAAGGNALSGARAAASQQYQNTSDANYQQNINALRTQDFWNQSGLNTQLANANTQAMTAQNAQQMQGWQGLFGMGTQGQATAQAGLTAPYQDWLRQIQGYQQASQYPNQLGLNTMNASKYQGFQNPQYGPSQASAWAALLPALLGGGGASGGGVLGSLLGTENDSSSGGNTGGLLGLLSNLFGGGTGNTDTVGAGTGLPAGGITSGTDFTQPPGTSTAGPSGGWPGWSDPNSFTLPGSAAATPGGDPSQYPYDPYTGQYDPYASLYGGQQQSPSGP